jgi:hypothetical protein
MKAATALCIGALLFAGSSYGFEKPDTTLQIFQFPADQIPRIDGDDGDWAIVPDRYAIGIDQMTDDSKKHPHPDPQQIDARVRVGWVKGLNRLYFFYEATQRYWDFALPGLHNDTFEVVVDGDASGGPLIDKQHKEFWTPEEVGAVAAAPDGRISDSEAHWAIHGVQAQNYHIFTPALNKDWALAWGSPTWIKDFPWANAAYSYSFKPGESGKLKLEFWITPFDYAGPEGPSRAVESILREDKLIGLAWAIIDYSDVNARGNDGFWNLSPRHTMYGNASALLGFRLMPLEPGLLKPIQAKWSHTVVDMDRRLVAFRDESIGKIDAWHWDFGDGGSSDEQFPTHQYRAPGNYVVVLDVAGSAGKSRHSKVWDVQLRR